ncbi:MAG: transposase [Clostridiales bacterium]|nr:transposase [Clostridiales bacterium]
MIRVLVRRLDVVGIFPNVAAALRLMGAVLEEQQEEGMASRKDFSPESMTRLTPAPGSFSGAATRKEGMHNF